MSSPRLRVIKQIAEKLGLEGLAEIEAGLVRERDVPERLLAALTRDDYKSLLSPREREVMVLLASGFSRQEIADQLGISLQTVKSHLSHCYAKLNAHRQVEAINKFIEWAA